MKKVFIAAMMLISSVIYAQDVPYNVVFDVTTMDTVVHQSVIRWVKGITESYPNANVEVVFYGKSLDMVSRDKSVVEAEVSKYAMVKNVSFAVCEVAMKKHNLTESQLIKGVKTVPDGLYEIVKKQHDGWAYIKAAR